MELRDEILEKLIERAASVLSKNISEFNENTIFADLDLKSVNYSQIITVLEDEFDVEIPFMDFKRKKTFGEAADFVNQIIEG